MSQIPSGNVRWYYAANGAQQGPVHVDALRELLRSGQLARSELVWCEGMPQWLPAESVPELAGTSFTPGIGAAAPVAPPIQDYARPPGGPIAMGYYAQPVGDVAYVGFWMRVLAYLIDYVVTYIFGFIVGFAIGVAIGLVAGASSSTAELAQALGALAGLVISWLYFALMESSVRQATLGKMAIGARVTDLNGNRISFGRATGRFFAKILSGVILGIGFIMVGVNPRKQGLHDQIASTLVLQGRAG